MDFVEQSIILNNKPFQYYSYLQPLSDYTLTNNKAAWQPNSQLNNEIRKQNNIRSNWEYRTYMTQHANVIRKYNTVEAQQSIGLPIYFKSTPL